MLSYIEAKTMKRWETTMHYYRSTYSVTQSPLQRLNRSTKSNNNTSNTTNLHSFVITIFFIVLIFTNSSQITAMAWSTKWISLDKSSSSTTTRDNFHKIIPPRSGHVTFVLHDHVYVFGGYIEERIDKRYPTNELWVYDTKSTIGWQKVVQGQDSISIPQQRLASAAVTCQFVSSGGDDETQQQQEAGVILGGWDSQEAGTGGVILQDIRAFIQTTTKGEGTDSVIPTGSWQTISFDLEQPTSRLCAVSVPSNPSQIMIHNHRCIDHVMIADMEHSKLIRQATTGVSPSPRGLHACVSLPNTPYVVVFGGAAQDGNMSNEIFILNTSTWKWTSIDGVGTNDADGTKTVPLPRASPCFVAIDERSCILYGGATRSDAGGLHGCNDMWLLEFSSPSSSNNNNENSKNIDCTFNKAKWTLLEPDGSSQTPPGRNAATLTPLRNKPAAIRLVGNDDDDDDNDGKNENTQYFLLSGGWYPFRVTYNDNYILQVTKR